MCLSNYIIYICIYRMMLFAHTKYVNLIICQFAHTTFTFFRNVHNFLNLYMQSVMHEHWNAEIGNSSKIFADNFLIFADNFSYNRKLSHVCRHSFSICRNMYVRYSFKRKLYMSILCSLCARQFLCPRGKQSEN